MAKQDSNKNLREEYKEFKQHKATLVTESAYRWFEENVIFIDEQIDRSMIRRIISSITKFDETFGPHKDKVPAIADQINAAEEGLQRVLTGKANDKKASDMLKRMSYLYSSFSRFFSSDLPVLLSSHIFDGPRNNPDVRMNVLRVEKGERYDPMAVRESLKHALIPSKDEQKLISTIYRSKSMPLIDAAGISSQLLGLSYHELEELTTVGKIPMVTTPPPAPAEPKTEQVVSTPVAPVTPTTVESVEPKKKVQKQLDEEVTAQPLLTEALSEEKFKDLIDQLKKLSAAFAPYKEKTPQLQKVLFAIQSRIRKIQGTSKGGQLAQALKNPLKTLWTPNVQTDVLNIYNMIQTFNRKWPQWKATMDEYPNDWPLDVNQITDPAQKKQINAEQWDSLSQISDEVKNMFLQAVKRPFFSRKSVIPPEKFVEEVMGMSKDELDQVTKGLALPEIQKFTMDMPNTSPGEKTAASTSTPTSPQPTAPTSTSEPPGKPAKAQPNAAPQVAQQSSEELEKVALEYMKKMKIPKARLGDVHTQLIALSKAGFNIIPRQ